MFEQLIYFMRRRPFYFYTFFIVFASIYSYILWLYFVERSEFYSDIFLVLLTLSIVWVFLFYINFKKTLNDYKFEREKEKFGLLKYRIINEFGLENEGNIFEKIEIINDFVDANFSKSSIAATRILMLMNKTLDLYISNLKLIRNIKNSTKAVSQDRLDQLTDIKAQNESFLTYLDNYISEFIKMNKNKDEHEFTEFELERMLETLKKINKGNQREPKFN